jgi:hypothetical protein
LPAYQRRSAFLIISIVVVDLDFAGVAKKYLI